MDTYGFYTGQSFDAYRELGAHRTAAGVVFRTFAPAAREIRLLWRGGELPMERVWDGNFFEITVAEGEEGEPYAFRILGQDGRWVEHCDPYGFAMELRPAHRSLLRFLGGYRFHDEAWMRRRTDCAAGPLNIYELHLGSWRRQPGGGWYRYDQIAEPLIQYLQESGYNYVEFLPLSEHPCDESWGYQNTGFFAPTSRYGTPDQLRALIDRLHQAKIGAILDFVPVHFAVDGYGLARYDGSALYEYPHRDVEVSEWGSHNFMHSRGEVRSFLQSAAHYWLEEFHFDGLRMDAVSRILYWQGDERRGVNGSGVEFLRNMNRGLKERHPDCILAAEDSTNFPKVTTPADRGGLGFDYKWDLGWMHDTLSYFQTDPACRPECYHKLTFSMMYFSNERYLLPLSHDEVVHGKATILQKMNGQYEGKFPQGRAMYLYMMVHPGKKLNFMGNEFGQLREWDEKREQDWMLRKFPTHDGFYHFMARLNGLYLKYPALWKGDYDPEGFAWLDCHQEARCIYAAERRGGGERLAAVFHFGDRPQTYTLSLPGVKRAETLLDSDWQCFGGGTPEGESRCVLEGAVLHCALPPFSAVLLKLDE